MIIDTVVDQILGLSCMGNVSDISSIIDISLSHTLVHWNSRFVLLRVLY